METKLGIHVAYNVNYHFVFCTKRRKPILVQNIAFDCANIIRKVAEEINIKIEALEIMPDHVHVFVSSSPVISPGKIVKKFKGKTSNILRIKYPQLLRIPALWSSSYYVGTIGHVSESVVKLYIENQKGK